MSGMQETSNQRRSRYLRLAAEASKLAAADKRVEVCETSLQLAESWLSLARGAKAAPDTETAD
jgi:hypothetical protein